MSIYRLIHNSFFRSLMNIPLIISGIYGFITIALGAYTDHHLKSIITPEQLESLSTAIRYNLLHAVIIAAIAINLPNIINKKFEKTLRIISYSFILGTFLFSFSIYTSILTGIHDFVKITPTGGVVLMFSWLSLSFCGFSRQA